MLKQIGGALFGALLSLAVSESIRAGAGFIYSQECEQWGAVFWGSHFVLRIIACLVGTILGSFAAGCISKLRGGIWGLVSALPVTFLWIFAALIQTFSERFRIQVTYEQWAVVAILTLVTPVVGFKSGSFGATVRMRNPDLFESRKSTILGIKWYHWLWLVFVIHWIGLLGTFSVFQGLFLLFGTKRITFWHSVNPTFAAFLTGLALCLLGLGAYKVYYLLLFGYRRGMTKGQITLRILGWVVGILATVGIFHALTGYLMSH